MKISIDVIQARTKQLNNNLELHLCNLALKAPPSFTRSYLLGTRSRIAKLGFERLVDEGVFELAGSNALGKTYRINLKKLDLYKHACTNRGIGSTLPLNNVP